MRKLSMLLAAAAVVAGVGLVATPAVRAVPAGFTDTLVQGGFSGPISVDMLPGGRLLVLEKGGAVELVRTDGSVTTAATLSACADGERGLLSAAVDPSFASNGVVYIYRTRPVTGGCANTLSRFTMSGDTLNVGSEQILVDNVQWVATNHNGGTVEVGRDGYLYLSVGEGADASRSQSKSSLGGKVLRITTSGAPAPGNPFASEAGHGPCARVGQAATVCEEIYSLGLRNPFRMAFDPNAPTTSFRINDVGSGTASREEVNQGGAGANYGWPNCESPCTPTNPAYTDPIAWYPRSVGTVIVGGVFIPNGWWGATYDGGYLFADRGAIDVWLLSASGVVAYQNPFTAAAPTDMVFGVRNGERALFYVDVANGQLRKIVGPNAATSAAAGPAYIGGPLPTPSPQPPVPPPLTGAYVFNAYPAAQRVFDSRNGIGGPVGRVAGGQARTIPLGVPSGASAALVNITLDNGSHPEEPCRPPSYLVAWQPGTTMPGTSNANVGSCDVAANTAIVQVDAAGAATIQVYADVDVVIDVLGSYSLANGPVSAGRFEALTPARLIDTRQASSAGNSYTRTDDGNTSSVRMAVTGHGGVPANAKTVSLTVTAIGPGSDAAGYVTAYAGGTAMPATSTVNHNGSGDTRANLALVPVGADGTIELYLYQVANVVVDVGGWITSASDGAATKGRLQLVAPTRIADSRNGIGVAPLAPGGQVTLEPTGVPAGASALVQNVTMVSHAPGWICATPNPWAGGDVSIQNAREANQDRPALAFTTLGQTAQPRLRYCSQDHADMIVDVMGWFE